MIVAGFGFRATATVDSLRAALLAAAGVTRIDLIAAPEDKAAAGPLAALARALNVPVAGIGAQALSATVTPTRSARVLAARATGSVAEAAALAAAGPGARLLARRHVSPDRLATCALAVGEGERNRNAWH